MAYNVHGLHSAVLHYPAIGFQDNYHRICDARQGKLLV